MSRNSTHKQQEDMLAETFLAHDQAYTTHRAKSYKHFIQHHTMTPLQQALAFLQKNALLTGISLFVLTGGAGVFAARAINPDLIPLPFVDGPKSSSSSSNSITSSNPSSTATSNSLGSSNSSASSSTSSETSKSQESNESAESSKSKSSESSESSESENEKEENESKSSKSSSSSSSSKSESESERSGGGSKGKN